MINLTSLISCLYRVDVTRLIGIASIDPEHYIAVIDNAVIPGGEQGSSGVEGESGGRLGVFAMVLINFGGHLWSSRLW